jgi:hypothetical protein
MGGAFGWLWACLVLAMHGRGALVTLVWLYTGAALAPHRVGLGLGSDLVLPWRDPGWVLALASTVWAWFGLFSANIWHAGIASAW